jgi:Na+-transporting NADH:ubiquinone oxidoreductase subunit C
MGNDSIFKTIAVATGVCVVCSVFVSTAAVMLKDLQEKNKTIDKKKNILVAAGVSVEGDVDELFESGIDAKVIDMATGEYVDDVKSEELDERKAAKDPQQGLAIGKKEDIAKIRRMSKLQSVYFSKDGTRVILPVHGKGLWSTMYGFIALDRNDLNTIKSFAFYEHGETPGLGGEVDAKEWKKSWIGKQAFDEDGNPAIKVVKGKADPGAIHEADGLAGATLTARGVDNLVRFWLGQEGYGPFLKKEKGEAGNG